MRHAFEIPEGWSAYDGSFDGFRDDYMFLTSPGWRLKQSQEGDGDASRPSILIMRQDPPAEGPRDALPDIIELARTLPGYRPISDGPSGLPQGRVFTHALSRPRFPLGLTGGRFECVRRAHLFVAGGHLFKVVSEAAEGEWEDGGLLRLAEEIEAGIAEENG